MRLTCTSPTCLTELNYSEPVILGLCINGLSDMELQQDLLAEQKLTLPKAITQAVARETAKRSQGIFDTNQQVVTSISTNKKNLNKVVLPPCSCGNCGNKRPSDRKDCPAKDNECSCGIKGHLRKYCYRETHRVGVERRPPRKMSQTPRRRLATALARTALACRPRWRPTAPVLQSLHQQ
jgi:predicted Zn-ribbon and HTH transcriptional regulator